MLLNRTKSWKCYTLRKTSARRRLRHLSILSMAVSPKPDNQSTSWLMLLTQMLYLTAFRSRLDWIEQCFTSPPTQYRLYGRRFYRSKDPTNSIKVLKVHIVHRQIKHTISRHKRKTANPLVYTNMGWQGMAPTEGRFAMPERRWDCRCGIPLEIWTGCCNSTPSPYNNWFKPFSYPLHSDYLFLFLAFLRSFSEGFWCATVRNEVLMDSYRGIRHLEDKSSWSESRSDLALASKACEWQRDKHHWCRL